MKIMKYTLLSLIILLSACAPKEDENDLSDYYFPLQDITQKKIYKYKKTMEFGFEKIIETNFIELSPINDNSYAFVLKTESGEPLDSSILSRHSDGVTISEKYSFHKNKWYAFDIKGCRYLHKNTGFVNDTCSTSYHVDFQDNRTLSINISVNFLGLRKKDFIYGNNMEVSELILHENTINTDSVYSANFISETTIYNAKNIGMVFMQTKGTDYTITYELVEIIE